MTPPTPHPSSQPGRALTPRQEEVLRHMLTGATADQIAAELSIGRATVQTHLRAIYAAFGVKSRARAVIAAIERGYLPGNVDPVWIQEREHVLRALKEAWGPCWAHPVYTPGCAVCVRAATLSHAIMLVRNPSGVSHLPPRAEAGPPPAGPQPVQPAMLARRPLARPGMPQPGAGADRRAAS